MAKNNRLAAGALIVTFFAVPLTGAFHIASAVDQTYNTFDGRVIKVYRTANDSVVSFLNKVLN
jgi:hypothetical protein